MHAQPSSKTRCLIFCQTLRLLPYFMCANSEGSSETARMRRLAWDFDGGLCDKYHNPMCWLKLGFRFGPKCLVCEPKLSQLLNQKKKKYVYFSLDLCQTSRRVGQSYKHLIYIRIALIHLNAKNPYWTLSRHSPFIFYWIFYASQIRLVTSE